MLAAASLKLRLSQLLLTDMLTMRANGVFNWKKHYDQAVSLCGQVGVHARAAGPRGTCAAAGCLCCLTECWFERHTCRQQLMVVQKLWPQALVLNRGLFWTTADICRLDTSTLVQRPALGARLPCAVQAAWGLQTATAAVDCTCCS